MIAHPLAEFVPQLNEWYRSSGEYGGGAEFTTEQGATIHGTGKVAWNDSGDFAISVQIAPTDIALAAPLMISDATFRDFKLTTPEGVFTSNKVYLAGSHSQFGAGFTTTFDLTALAAEFVPSASTQAEYWVAPLNNFISEFKVRSDGTDRHPLRLYTTPIVTAEAPCRLQRIYLSDLDLSLAHLAR